MKIAVAWCSLALPLLLTCACRSYRANPVDWKSELGSDLPQKVAVHTVDDAVKLALVGNRKINALRLDSAMTEKVAQQAGWWEDPEFEFDLMRIVNPGDNPFLGGAGFSFSIPLTGVKKSGRRVAQLYGKVAAMRVLAAERDLSVDVRKVAIEAVFAQKKIAMLKDYHSNTSRLARAANVSRLLSAGEISIMEAGAFERLEHRIEHRMQDAKYDYRQKCLQLCELFGLLPGVEIELKMEMNLQDALAEEKFDALKLTGLPQVRAAMLELEVSEEILRGEILKQYPELKIGPAYAREEGSDRFGFTAGLTLPLWNRNRKAIAEATSNRDRARLAAIDVWRELVWQRQKAYEALLELSRHDMPPKPDLTAPRRLVERGEIGDLEYLGFLEDELEFNLDELEWRGKLCVARAEMSRFGVEE